MNKAQLKALQATRRRIFRDLDGLRRKHGAAALPAMRRYLLTISERKKRLDAIVRLRRELAALNRKGA